MIRWKYVLPRIALLAMIVLLVNAMANPLTRLLLIQSAQSVTGARVNIARVDASLWGGQLSVTNLQCADPRDPMKNLIQIESGEFSLDPGRALHKQWVVENASLKLLQFGTPRTESGALTKVTGKVSTIGSALVRVVRDQARHQGQLWLHQLEGQLPTLVHDNLETVKLARELGIQWPAEFERQRSRAMALKQRSEAILNTVQKRTDNPLRDTEVYFEAINESRRIAEDVAIAQQELHQLTAQFQHDQEALVEAQQRDQTRISTIASDFSLNGESLNELLLGEEQANRVTEVVGWIKWFRDSIPNPEVDFQPPGARGYDVTFSRHPEFLFQNLELGGEGIVGGKTIKFFGTAVNLSTAPQLMSEPVSIELRGQGDAHVHVMATIDRRTIQSIDTIRINCPQIQVPGCSLGKADSLLVSMGPSNLSLLFDATVVDDQIKGQIQIRQSDVKMEVQQAASLAGGQALVQSLNSQIADLNGFSVTVDLSGTVEGPRMELQSDLGQQIADMMGSAFRENVAQATETKVAELQKILDQQLAGLNQIFNSNSNEILILLTNEVTAIASLEDMMDSSGIGLPKIR